MTSLIPLEDLWNDVIRKARRGLGFSEEELSRKLGCSADKIMALEQGALDADLLAQVATSLGLEAGRLLALARGEYHPGALALPDGMMMFTSPWQDFEVHSYLLWDQKSGQAVAFDTGSDATEMLSFLSTHELTLRQILLTHGHGDHVFDLERIVEKTGARAWIGKRENVPGAENFEPGREFELGELRIETRATWGHAAGGITYVIHGLAMPVAIVGDALFAGSMGGPMISYAACLETNRKEIFSLPSEMLLCPGHGPLTTVALEKEHNPYFSAIIP